MPCGRFEPDGLLVATVPYGRIEPGGLVVATVP